MWRLNIYTGPESMSLAYLNLFDGPLLNMCVPRYELPPRLHVDLLKRVDEYKIERALLL